MDNITPTMHCMWSGVHFSYQTEAEAEAEEVEVEVRIHSLAGGAGHRSHIHGFLRLSNFKLIKSFAKIYPP